MTKRLVIFALAVMSFAAAPHALKAADADALCPLGSVTVRGAYMTQGTGSFVGVGPIFVNLNLDNTLTPEKENTHET